MAKKKYTMYYRGKNKYMHEHDIPIISLELKSMDEYTSNYKDYVELLKHLPIEIYEFIKKELSYGINIDNNDDLKECFYITDNDFNPIMDVIFEDDVDVLYITPFELVNLIVREKMTHQEYQSILLNINSKEKVDNKYAFFKYLYDTYVKNQKVECMIDVYETNNVIPNLSSYDLLVASVATDKDNIIVLCKKIGEFDETRRNLALKFKKLFVTLGTKKKFISYKTVSIRKNRNIDIDIMGNKILDNFNKFINKYEKEYEIGNE